MLIDLNALKDMAGMTKQDIGPMINHSFGKWQMSRVWSRASIWSPMGRNNQQIHLLSCLFNTLKEMLCSWMVTINGYIKDTWCLLCCLPVWLIIGKSKQADGVLMNPAERRIRSLPKIRTDACKLDGLICQSLHHSKHGFILVIQDMVIGKRHQIHPSCFQDGHVFLIGSKMKDFWCPAPGLSSICKYALQIADADIRLLEEG